MYVCPPACLVLEAQSARDHLFPISSIPDWEKARPGAASEKEKGGVASSGHPSFAPSKLRLALASMLSQQLRQPHKEPSFLPPAVGAWVLPQTINLLVKTFRNSSPTLTGPRAKAAIPFAIKFYFIFLGVEVRGRRSPDLICSMAKYCISCKGIHLCTDPCLLLVNSLCLSIHLS